VTDSGDGVDAGVLRLHLTEVADARHRSMLGFGRVEPQPGTSSRVTVTADPGLLARVDAVGPRRLDRAVHRIASGKVADNFALTTRAARTERLFGSQGTNFWRIRLSWEEAGMAQETESVVAQGPPARMRAREVGSRRIKGDAAVAHGLSRRTMLRGGACCLVVAATAKLSGMMQDAPLAVPVAHAQAARPGGVLFENVRIFDGTSGRLSGPSNVLVVDNIIRAIASTPLDAPAGLPVQRIQGGGRTLMPGLIDNHWHTILARISPSDLLGDISYVTLQASTEAEATLMRGFTTVRDLGGPAFGLKRAIDDGLAVGPRVYPSGALITVTGGHGDFRSTSELPRQLGGPPARMEVLNGSMLADSPDEVRVRAREQLMLGASQIKLTAGGGVASPHSPLDIATFTEDELRAAVQAAGDWNTYVTVHAYTPIAIKRSIAAGVKVIEHGHLMDEEAARLMGEKGIWLSFQPFTDDGFTPPLAPANMLRLREVWTGTERTMAWAKQYGIKTAFGTDILFTASGGVRQGAELAKMGAWYSPAQVLTMATSINAELLKLSGPRDPYPGKLGVVEEGAFADLLLVDGDPLTNLQLFEDPDKNLVVIMKDGKVFKNRLPSS
jgi:imidazolonepropionase-like amidohydrolase